MPKELNKKDDSAGIVGTWTQGTGITCWFQIAANDTLKTWHDPNRGFPSDWTYTLDPTASPKRLKLTTTGQQSYDCIYELDGDTLKIAFILGAKDPKMVEAASGLQLYEQTRDTSAK